MHVATLLAGLVWAGGFAPDEQIVYIQHHRPSKFIAKMIGGPSDYTGILGALRIRCHDERGLVVLSGTQEELFYAKRWIELFDVAPRVVELKVQMESPLDKYQVSWIVRCPNNATTDVLDLETGLRLTLRPRIAEDGQIVVLATFQAGAERSERKVRSKIGSENSWRLESEHSDPPVRGHREDQVYLRRFTSPGAKVSVTATVVPLPRKDAELPKVATSVKGY